MIQPSKNQRINYIALDKNVINSRYDFIPSEKFTITKNVGWDIMPLDQRTPIVISLPKQAEFSRNKLGADLLRKNECEQDFNLRDPYMYQNRCTIQYHPLHDPALKSFLNRTSIKNKIRAIHMITKNDDAICSRKDFYEYVRYLDSRRAEKILRVMRIVEDVKLKKHFEQLNSSADAISRKQLESDVAIRRTQKIAEAHRKRRLKFQRHQKELNAAIHKSQWLKETKLMQIKEESILKEAQIKSRREKLRKNQIRRKNAMIKIFTIKQELAAECKILHQNNAKNEKRGKEAEFMRKQYLFREEHQIATNYLRHFFENQRADNVQRRIEQSERTRELFEEKFIGKKANAIQRMYENKTSQDVTKHLMAQISVQVKNAMKHLDVDDSEEIIRRYSLLTKTNVEKCVNVAFDVFRELKIPHSTTSIVTEAIKILRRKVVQVPDIVMPRGAYIRRYICEYVSETINGLKDEHLHLVQSAIENRIMTKKHALKGNSADDLDDINYSDVMINDSTISIGTSSYWECLNDWKSTENRPPTPILSLHKVIKYELIQFFEDISKEDLFYPETMNTRELLHLHDFQKFLLFKNCRCLERFIKQKVELYWTRSCTSQKVEKIDSNQNDLIEIISDCILIFPDQCDKFAQAVCSISKTICMDTFDKIQK